MSCFKLYSNLQNTNRYLVRIRVDICSTSHSSPFPRKRQNPEYSLICYQHQSVMKPLFSGMSMSSDFSSPRCRNTFQTFQWASGSPTGWQLGGISYPWRETKQTHSRDLSKKIFKQSFLLYHLYHLFIYSMAQGIHSPRTCSQYHFLFFGSVSYIHIHIYFFPFCYSLAI